MPTKEDSQTARPEKGERRNRDLEVMDAAIRIIFEKGYSGASLQDVANEVGVLKGSLYYYFSSKEDLLLRIMKESHAHAEEIFQEIAARNLPAIDELGELLQAFMKWYLGNVERVAIYFNERRRLTGKRLEEVEQEGRRFEQHFYELLKQAQGEGTVDAGLDLRLSVRLFLGALNSVPSWYQPGRNGRKSDDKIAAQFAEMALKSIAV